MFSWSLSEVYELLLGFNKNSFVALDQTSSENSTFLSKS